MKNLNRFIEQTNLRPTLVADDIDILVKQAKEHQFVGICVPPFWVKRAARELEEEDIQLVTVVGFPLGYNMTEVKLTEIELAMKDGADEIDMVLNISAFKSNLPWAKIDIAKCTNAVHQESKLIKVIIETDYLSKEEIVIASKMCADAGVDYVKTSTGFANSGAQVEDIQLMRDVLPSNVGLKASGGIKTYEQALALINAGADRLGTSSGVDIIKQL